MKISKLFHWLYAILMLLPVFFIGGRVLYTIFNKNAKDSYSGMTEENYISYDNINIVPLNTTIYSWISNDTSYENTYYLSISDLTYIDTNVNNLPNTQDVAYIRYYSNGQIYFTDSGQNSLGFYTISNGKYALLSFKLLGFTNDLQGIGSCLGYFNNINGSLDNAFSYSVNQLNENVLFSWAKDSFIVEPFRYITGLFGMPSDSPVLTLLSYWCSISLIWLTFDLLMYVPLLVHRWLDKGVLE